MYTIYKFNYEYVEMNFKNYHLWNFVQIDFEKFEVREFNELNNTTWKVIRDYCYIHRF